MVPLHYKLVFSVLDPGYRPWLGPAIALVAVVAGTIILPLVIRPRNLGMSRRDIGIVLGCAALLTATMVINFVVTLRDFLGVRAVLLSGTALYVEGKVADFSPMPFSGKGNEHFDVDGVPFSYSGNLITVGFRQTVRDGGPMQEGLPVHIWYSNAGLGGNEILKLEIAGG